MQPVPDEPEKNYDWTEGKTMDDELISNLQCDVAINIAGWDDAAINKRTADVLRKAAAMVESGDLETGFIDLRDDTGKKVGTIYLDHSEGGPFTDETPN
ncbi:hypothetical protein VW29_05775 [Devosia limi DSM 17137]|uniref:Uncharacterized protein n=2 Tax=Devosia TaxID=46913 RepID=A0A0F5LU39_9HYPH|nr:hypothetical protein VW29_05775 [Devosia limi DSM 17137]SHE33248.1 hypothetical protein SAMN02745223_00089 [Devosia limi DSM 17137]